VSGWTEVHQFWPRILLSLQHKPNQRMGIWQQLAEYLYLKKRDPNAPHSRWMSYMHGINRISIFMFLLALIIILLKIFVFKKH